MMGWIGLCVATASEATATWRFTNFVLYCIVLVWHFVYHFAYGNLRPLKGHSLSERRSAVSPNISEACRECVRQPLGGGGGKSARDKIHHHIPGVS